MANDILVLVEVKGNKVKKASLELLSEAGRLSAPLGGSVKALVIGHDPDPIAAELGAFGVAGVYAANQTVLKNYSPERYAAVVTEACRKSNSAVVLATAGSLGRDLMPRAAARLDTGMITECTALRVDSGKIVGQRPMYAGKVLVDVTIPTSLPQIVTCRPNVFEVSPAKPGATPTIEAVGQEAATLPVKARLIERIEAKSDRPDLTEASVIVAAGRAIKSSENFALVDELADVLGAAVGATRAAVDAGLASHSIQIGQTGKTVNPKLYIGAGVSGSIQHLAGMQTSKVVVAVNTDPEAPIFAKADYGIVGDLFEVLPLLTEQLKKLLKE